MTMRKLLSLSLILALFAGVGCDSNDDDDEPNDAQMIAGTWGVSKIRNNATGSDPNSPANMDLTPFIFGNMGSVKDNGFTFTFTPTSNTGGTYTLKVEYKDPEATPVNIPPAGAPASTFTYTVTPSASARGEGTLRLMVPLNETTIVPADLPYEITSSTGMTVMAPSALMGQIFQSDIYKGNVAIEFVKR